ncbi:MAG TPA: dipeptidase [Ignavibacteriaceae bacterium]|jgi:membrane dipeptidase|nr:MAG: Membrane dipeptidase (Peptidase family M19) [Ignavibacteria bacterium ADurb.Bin266]OQY71714.1 MAG: peptidase M19 [Ignavibacteriales bacterium UTCHB2]HQF41778.1 dipeptidase [Ignavibacteriaceae bacterium]HQI41929.1 dipeptidase [Ignavibacteriaceae bacterium]
MKNIILLVFTAILFATIYPQNKNNNADSILWQKAVKICKDNLLVDTHIDLPDWLYDEWFDVSVETDKGEIDYERAIKGGLNVGFMSIYTSPSLETKGKSKIKADSMISIVHKMVELWPDKFLFVRSTSDIMNNFNKNKILLTMGMENGSPVENNLANLKEFYDKGVRYITLAHYKWNHIADSANDPEKKWNGLSPFGEEVVKEMNRLGIMVDISHVSDSTFYDVIKLSQAPVIASHSCCRFFTLGYERNMNDDMIKELAKNGGVIQLAFANFFLRNDTYQAYTKGENNIKNYLKENNIASDSELAWKYEEQYWKDNPLPPATVKDVADHIDHIKNLVGIDYIGLGSDFNGTGGMLPVDLKDVSEYPNLVYELLLRGYTENEIAKILGGNLLRVWKEVEKVASE